MASIQNKGLCFELNASSILPKIEQLRSLFIISNMSAPGKAKKKNKIALSRMKK